ncbi:MAG TPA: triose-phosphate isomerase, partial [Candidatus Limnocylindria bacterium]|nr:triose-phosphate isomerase [Candidatus Limnocylindria bacterium]
MSIDRGRTPVVAGNWKMNPTTLEEAVRLATAVRDGTAGLTVRTVVCPPFVFLPAVARAVAPGGTEPGGLGIGAQTMHAVDSGAYTGEIAPIMLAGLAQYVIIGHSERRQYFNETDTAVAAKVAAAVTHGLVPIMAVGESAAERAAGLTSEVVDRQMRAAISGLDRIEGSGLVIAYEPVWAIGTGLAATPDDA